MRSEGETVHGAVAIRMAVACGAIRAEAIVRAALERIAQREPALHAWETLGAAQALAQARAIDAGLAAGGAPGLLAGVPLGVKDILDAAGLPTRFGSPLHANARPAAADAQAVARVRAEHAVVMGKTATTELAYFTPGPTTNPWNAAHTPGGSSSGSAAAVAAGMVPLAFGTQTAGSVIRPASFCGVFALKPTFGAVSLDGALAFAPSLDTLGWFARDADDLELMRCALAGAPWEPLPATSPGDWRLGICRTHEEPQLDAGGAAAWAHAQRLLATSRAAVQAVAMPASLAGLVEAQKTVMAFEAAASFAAEWRDHADQLSPALRALLEAGHAVPAAERRRALDLAQRARGIVAGLMRDVDVLVVPSAPGEALAGLAGTGDPLFNRVWTLLGLPCVNVPGLRGPTGLPIGVQLVGRAGEERRLLAAAACLHRVVSGR